MTKTNVEPRLSDAALTLLRERRGRPSTKVGSRGRAISRLRDLGFIDMDNAITEKGLQHLRDNRSRRT